MGNCQLVKVDLLYGAMACKLYVNIRRNKWEGWMKVSGWCIWYLCNLKLQGMLEYTASSAYLELLWMCVGQSVPHGNWFLLKKYGKVGNGVYTSERTWHVCFWCDSPQWARASSFTRFLEHTQRRTTDSMTPLDEWSARRRDLYLTTHSIHNRHTSMPSVGFESTISAGERPLEPATLHIPVNISTGHAPI
jgi:hypothetical protein